MGKKSGGNGGGSIGCRGGRSGCCRGLYGRFIGAPRLPFLLGQGVTFVAIKHLPERRAPDTLSIQDGEAKAVTVDYLVGVFINPDLSGDTLNNHHVGYKRPLNYIEVLSKAANGHIHILKGLGKHIDRNLVMAVILEEFDSRLGESLVVSVVKLHASFIYNHLATRDIIDTDILPGIQLVSASNGDIRPNRDFPFPAFTVQNPGGKTARKTLA